MQKPYIPVLRQLLNSSHLSSYTSFTTWLLNSLCHRITLIGITGPRLPGALLFSSSIIAMIFSRVLTLTIFCACSAWVKILMCYDECSTIPSRLSNSSPETFLADLRSSLDLMTDQSVFCRSRTRFMMYVSMLLAIKLGVRPLNFWDCPTVWHSHRGIQRWVWPPYWLSSKPRWSFGQQQ